MNFMNIGTLELMVIIAIAILAVGPKRMVEVARMIGRLATRMRQISGEFTSIIRSEFSELEEARQEVQAAVGEITGRAGEPAATSDVTDAVKETKADADQSMQSLLEDGLGLRQIASELKTTATEARQFVERASREEEEAEGGADLPDAAAPGGDEVPPTPDDHSTDEAAAQPASSEDEGEPSSPAAAPAEDGAEIVGPEAMADEGSPAEGEDKPEAVVGEAEETPAGGPAGILASDAEGTPMDPVADDEQSIPVGEVGESGDAEDRRSETGSPGAEIAVAGQVAAAVNGEGEASEPVAVEYAPATAGLADQTSDEPGPEATAEEPQNGARPAPRDDVRDVPDGADAHGQTPGIVAIVAGPAAADAPSVTQAGNLADDGVHAQPLTEATEPTTAATGSDAEVGRDEV